MNKIRAGDAVRVILHVGMHKTGTSALQNSLYAHRDALLKAGILYPTAGLNLDSPQAGYRHLLLRRSLEQEGAQSFAIKQLRQEIANSSCHTVVLSYEGFFTPATDVSHLREALHGFDTTVLLYLRHPVDYLESKYREWIRLLSYAGEIEDFLSWQWPFLDVLNQASEWEEQFGPDQMVIRSYDSLQSPRDILDQLLALIPASEVTLEPHPENNPGPTNEYTLAKLMANRLRLAGRPVAPQVVASMETDYGSNGGRLLSSEAVEEIQRRSGPAFAELLKRYGQNPDLTSRWAARPRDDAFFDSAVRASVIRQLEAAKDEAAAAAQRKADERAEARSRVRHDKQALERTLVHLEKTKARIALLQRRLNKTRKRLEKVQRTKEDALTRLEHRKAKVTQLKVRLNMTNERLQQVEVQRDRLQRRLDLLKVWHSPNWPEYAAIVRRRLKRSISRRR